jgi:hypothetical protein
MANYNRPPGGELLIRTHVVTWCVVLLVWVSATGCSREQGRPAQAAGACMDATHIAAAEAFSRTPVDPTTGEGIRQILVEYGFARDPAEPRAFADVQGRFAKLLESRTNAWRHVLARIAMRRIELPSLPPMLGEVALAGELLWSDARGVLAIDSGLVLLAHEVANREGLTDSMIGALYSLTEPAPFGSNPRLAKELMGPRTLLCVLGRQAGAVHWSDTVSSFVQHLVPSLLLILEISDPTWRPADSDATIASWPLSVARLLLAERLSERRRAAQIWRGG